MTTANPSNPGSLRTPFGGALGTEWRSFRAGTRIGAAEAAPTSLLACALVANHRRAIFAVRLPVGVTALHLSVGRWTQFPAWAWNNGTLPAGHTLAGGFGQFVTVADHAFAGAAGDVFVAELETFGDPVGAWVHTFTGAVDPADSVQLWLRGAG